MAALIIDPWLQEQVIKERQRLGLDHLDEVWEGVYVMTPAPNNEHQELVGELFHILFEMIRLPKLGKVYPGVNLTDRDESWEDNFRVPDLTVFLNATKAQNKDTHWLGGADFLIEIISPYDQTRDKLPFYEKIGVREVLLIDRDPWQLELYKSTENKLQLAGKSSPEDSAILKSDVIPLAFRLIAGDERPQIEVNRQDVPKQWIV